MAWLTYRKLIFLWSTCSFGKAPVYPLENITAWNQLNLTEITPWEAAAAGLSHSSQWLWSPWATATVPLSITLPQELGKGWNQPPTSPPQPQESLAGGFITCLGALEMLHVPGLHKGCCCWKSRAEEGMNGTSISDLTQKRGQLWRSKLKTVWKIQQ